MKALRTALAFLIFVSGFVASTAFAQGQGQGQGQGQAQKAAGITVPITGVGRAGTAGAGATFDGEFTIQRFVATSDGVVAVGVVKGIVTQGGTKTSVVSTVTSGPVSRLAPGSSLPTTSPDSNGGRLQRTAMLPVQAGVCEILNLVLGPLHLDLLGLVIDLNRVVLNITAVAGAGNLLGNLLCAIVGLLDGTASGTLAQLANLLNQLLAILG